MSKSDDEEDLSIRDKFALSILNGLLSHPTLPGSTNHITNFHTYFDSKATPGTTSVVVEQMERYVRCAYQIADMMRKVRLSSFE